MGVSPCQLSSGRTGRLLSVFDKATCLNRGETNGLWGELDRLSGEKARQMGLGTLGENRTPNLLFRRQALYPLSYEGVRRRASEYTKPGSWPSER